MEIGSSWGNSAGGMLPLIISANPSDVNAILKQLTSRIKLSPRHQLCVWWKCVRKNTDKNLDAAMSDAAFWNAVLSLCASADEACRGIGQLCGNKGTHTEMSKAFAALRMWQDRAVAWEDKRKRRKSTTACIAIAPSRAITLPKFHTPPVGMTIRALSHHISLCPGTEVKCEWSPWVLRGIEHSLNVLIVPWPTRVSPSQFSASTLHANLPDCFGRFDYTPGKEKLPLGRLRQVIRKAISQCSDIDGVILPELAVASPEEYEKLVDCVLKELKATATKSCSSGIVINTKAETISTSSPRFVIAGVQSGQGKMKENKAISTVAFWTQDKKCFGAIMEQSKHHCWKLDNSQIRRYSLGRQLDQSKEWWEHHNVSKRDVQFFALSDWLCVCPVICEDLARPDPLIEILHAVGPTLVVALLMDGPQVSNRWPGRYAMALADDPGSSVLTVTSLGMMDLSATPVGKDPSRSIGLWKTSGGGEVTHLELKKGADAMVITLSREFSKEWTIDGRHDDGNENKPGRRKARLQLTGMLSISV